MAIKKIEVIREFPFSELSRRLKTVGLRGFPDVKPYRSAKISINSLSPEQVEKKLFTPQPSVYLPQLQNVSNISRLFTEQGTNIFQLNGSCSGIDYVATDENGKQTEWTIIPPVVEVLPFEFNRNGRLDYHDLIGEELKARMNEKGYKLNQEVRDLNPDVYDRFRGGGMLSEICDGSHRIEVGKRFGLEQNILVIQDVVAGFPYYAAPQPYSAVHEEPVRDVDKLDKVHILTEPGHKLLYRLFPSGGIKSGDIRLTKGKVD